VRDGAQRKLLLFSRRTQRAARDARYLKQAGQDNGNLSRIQPAWRRWWDKPGIFPINRHSTRTTSAVKGGHRRSNPSHQTPINQGPGRQLWLWLCANHFNDGTSSYTQRRGPKSRSPTGRRDPISSRTYSFSPSSLLKWKIFRTKLGTSSLQTRSWKPMPLLQLVCFAAKPRTLIEFLRPGNIKT
jgi:hypothetical protein